MKTFMTFARMLTTVAMLWVLPSAASAFNCTLASTSLDTDGDGIVDADECRGLILPVCNGTQARSDCVDPASPDLFVLFNPPVGQSVNWPSASTILGTISALPTKLPDGTTPTVITAHAVDASKVDSSRRLTTTVAPFSNQKVVRVTESTLTGTGIIGVCEWGTPNGLDDCTVYTQRAKDVAATLKLNSTDVIRWVINHEVGHATNLTAAEDAQRGHHEPADSGTVMEESLGSRYGVPTKFSSTSEKDVRLK